MESLQVEFSGTMEDYAPPVNSKIGDQYKNPAPPTTEQKNSYLIRFFLVYELFVRLETE